MIFSRDKSQMCNNLLQFAHVYAWAREHNRSVMSMRFSYKYPYFNISKSKYASFPMYLFAKYTAAVKLLPTASFKHDDCDKDALEQMMLRHKHIVVSGWFVRYYDLFLKYRSEICELFTVKKQYSDNVKEKMMRCEAGTADFLRLGVHIRRGDYATWNNGIYCYSDETYASYISAFAKLHPEKPIHVYLSTNDASVKAEHYQQMLSTTKPNNGNGTVTSTCNIKVHLLGGNAVEDLFMLSECDYLIGAPSTYSLVAAMYRDIPLCRIDTVKAEDLTKESFRLFDYWFRRIV